MVLPSTLAAGETVAPSRPCVAVPSSISSLATRSARFDGIAKPTPMLPDWRSLSPAAGDGHVDADQLALRVEQCATGVARVDRGVGLDDRERDASTLADWSLLLLAGQVVPEVERGLAAAVIRGRAVTLLGSPARRTRRR